MSNIAFIKVRPSDDYVDVEVAGEISLTASKNYTLQINGQCIVCEAESKPSNGGFYITNDSPFQYKKGDGKLWIKNLTNTVIFINIAE